MSLRIANIYFLLSLIIMTLIVSQLFFMSSLMEGLDSQMQYLPAEFFPSGDSNFNSRYKNG